MRLYDYEKRYYKSVGANDSDYYDIDIATDEYLILTHLGADAPPTVDTKVEIIVDPTGTPEILLACHNSTYQNVINRKIDGPETVRIKLSNDSSQSETMGGLVQGEYYG